MPDISYRATMWAEMKPDCYGGKTCDQIRPRWYTYADGDKDASYENEPLNLAARSFPPGTKVTVQEPSCPECGDQRSPKWPTPKRGPIYEGPCTCGFDWDGWVLDQYS